jgi:transcriptional regulator with PAS, ATPase and Fis domain
MSGWPRNWKKTGRYSRQETLKEIINLNELQVTIRNGIEAVKLRKEVNSMRRDLSREFSFDQIIGESPSMKRMITLAHKVAGSEASSVLLQGESGTGKDLVAKAIHYSSRRADKPFVAINCAAIPPTLIESELFGYENNYHSSAMPVTSSTLMRKTMVPFTPSTSLDSTGVKCGKRL